MKKLIRGIIDFRKKFLPTYRETFSKLALGQFPDTLFIACSDSRVAPNVFASTDPGDLFVVRNVGNMIPLCGPHGLSLSDQSEAAAIEFALTQLQVSDIIVCGHSECGAMQALLRGRERVGAPHLKQWLRHGEEALTLLKTRPSIGGALPPHNKLSQLNVLQQMENLKSYPLIQEKLIANQLTIHGWWFELQGANVYSYDLEKDQFVVIDEEEAEKILKHLSREGRKKDDPLNSPNS